MRLQQRLAQANARMDAVRPLLPPGLRGFVQSGSTDEEGWTLLASGPAVAAKLRQLLPRLEERLHSLDIRPSAIRIRVQTSRPTQR